MGSLVQYVKDNQVAALNLATAAFVTASSIQSYWTDEPVFACEWVPDDLIHLATTYILSSQLTEFSLTAGFSLNVARLGQITYNMTLGNTSIPDLVNGIDLGIHAINAVKLSRLTVKQEKKD